MNTQKTINRRISCAISNTGISSVNYIYKSKKQKRKHKYYCDVIHTTGKNEIEKNYFSNERLRLYPNQTDITLTYVVIKFYLPRPADAKLVLMDSDVTEAIYLLNKELEAGNHTIITEIKNEELSRFNYYYNLVADGYSEVKQMRELGDF